MTSTLRVSATALVGISLLLLTSAASCIPSLSEDRLSQACGVVVDGSGSGGTNGFNAQNLVESKVDGFLNENKCQSVVFAPIDGNSEASVCKNNSEKLDLDPDAQGNVDRRKLRASKRKEAVTAAQQILKCIREDKRVVGGSDVLGGLRVISEERPLSNDDSFVILVVSDFVQADPVGITIDFKNGISTEQRRAALIQQLEKQHLVADLSNTVVTTAGFGTLYDKKQSKEYPAFRLFWEEFMKKTECRSFRHD